MKTCTTAIVALLTFLLVSCKRNTAKHTAFEPSYKIALHLIPGSKYYYNISGETITKIEVQDKTVESQNSSTIGLIYEVLVDTAGGSLLKITYDSFHLVTKKGEEEKEMDAANAAQSLDPVEKMLGVIKGNSIIVKVNSKGKVVSINGFKEITGKLMTAVNVTGVPYYQVQQMQNQLSGMLGEGFIKNSLEQHLTLLPDTVLYIGDSWKKDAIQSGDMQINAAGNFTLNSVKDSIAEIETTSSFDNSLQSNPVIMGYKASADFKGNEEGSYRVNINTGMMESGESTASMKGSVEVRGMEVPVTLKMKKSITVKKM